MEWEEEYTYEQERPPYVAMVLCSALISATTVVVLSLLMDNLASGGKISVPALVGLAPAQAGATARQAGLILATGGQVQDPVIEPGKVARQAPLAGTQARQGQVVTITLSRGPDQVTVKKVSGLPLARAQEVLRTQGLKPGSVQFEEHAELPAGQVIRTSPSAGSTVSREARLNLVVSRGKETGPAVVTPPAPPRAPAAQPAAQRSVKRVPKVTGIRMKYAFSRLRSSGLLPGRISYRSDEDHMEEYVLSQSPAPGAPCVKGDTVNLVVNRVE